MGEKKLAYDFWNTPEGIRSQKIFDMRDRIRRLETEKTELLKTLESANDLIEADSKMHPIDINRPESEREK